jgi:type VI secretion system protein
MPLKLTITSYQRLSPGQETTKILDRGSIAIGRATQNDWVLQDPERILSKHHCTVLYRDGAYHLTDLSVNGTFLNDSEQRIARDQTVELKDGDHFILGEYEIAVALQPEAADLVEAVLEEPRTDIVPASGTDLFGTEQPHLAGPRKSSGLGASPDIAHPPFDDILSRDRGDASSQYRTGAVPGAAATAPSPDLSSPERINFELPSLMPGVPSPKPTPKPTPPAALRQPTQQPTPPVSTRSAELLIPPPQEVAESPAAAPSAVPDVVEQQPVGAAGSAPESLIPDDWWMQPSTPPIAAAPIAPRPVTQTPVKSPPPVAPPDRPAPPTPLGQDLETPRPAPQPTAVAAPTAPGADVLLRALFEGAGLPQLKLTEEQLPEVAANLGAILRETVQGLMEILLARGDVKGEFRLDRTTMGPVENNPLKTPPGRPPLSPEEVMTLLLVQRKEAYMSPVQAVREGFNDIKAHQLAVVAGIQAALNRLLERFDPSNLEARLEQSMFDNLWPANRKAKYWDLFTAEYQAIAREAEDDFNELFGDEFARAYENRLRAH